MKRSNCYVLLLVMVFFACERASVIEATEIRPFVLPSARPSAQTENIPSQRIPDEKKLAVYEKFEADVRQMSQDKKKETLKYYQQLQNDASLKGDATRKDYYGNLIRILIKYL